MRFLDGRGFDMGETTLYRPVRGGKGALSERVAQQIIELIAGRHLAVGSRLPSLEELGQYLGVSRTAVREAIKLLDAWGVVEVKHGVGTFVADIPGQALAIPFRVAAERGGEAMWSLHQLREALEPAIAALAAGYARSNHLTELEMLLQRMEQALDEYDAYLLAAKAFHTTLARTTGNDLFSLIMAPILEAQYDNWHSQAHNPGMAERSQSYHRQLVAQIKAGRADAARATMAAHLRQVRKDRDIQLGSEGEGSGRRDAHE
jgi:GntR family transcriptional repressor for pyruvate dehydrogenase complex